MRFRTSDLLFCVCSLCTDRAGGQSQLYGQTRGEEVGLCLSGQGRGVWPVRQIAEEPVQAEEQGVNRHQAALIALSMEDNRQVASGPFSEMIQNDWVFQEAQSHQAAARLLQKRRPTGQLSRKVQRSVVTVWQPRLQDRVVLAGWCVGKCVFQNLFHRHLQQQHWELATMFGISELWNFSHKRVSAATEGEGEVSLGGM